MTAFRWLLFTMKTQKEVILPHMLLNYCIFLPQTLKNKFEKSTTLQNLFNGEIGMSAVVTVYKLQLLKDDDDFP